MKQERYYHKGEMADHCVVLLAHMVNKPNYKCSVNKLAAECGIPVRSLCLILKDAKDDKFNSTLFIHAMKHGYDFHVFNNWNKTMSYYSSNLIIDVVRKDWTEYKYGD